MASPSLNIVRKVDWPLGNPWLWLLAGTALCVWSWLWVVTFGSISSENRIIVLALGLLVTAAGVWLRFRDRERTYLAAWSSPVAVLSRLAMGIVFAAVALGVTVLFVATFYVGDEIGWRTAPTLLVWLSAAPLSIYAARRCLKGKDRREPLSAEEEIGWAFLVAAGAVYAGSWALYLGPAYVDDWDTIRIALRVLAVACLYASGLVLVSTRVRRLVLSFLFVLHFAGIATAALSAPPSPWLVQQTWVRVFRPYLEFMYLNNAYHFYAPEPGPSTYLWFRLIYTDEDGVDQGWWYKVPEINDKGQLGHAVALEYQRYLALTESVGAYDPSPSWYAVNEARQLDFSPIYKNRLELQPAVQQIVGGPNRSQPRIPLHPLVPQANQLIIPNDLSRKLLSSYARHVTHRSKETAKEGWTFKSVKVYRVVHFIPPVGWYVNRFSPTDPELYRPYYMGTFDERGVLLDTQPDRQRDPYLYWLVPILRSNPNDPNSEIRDFCRLHAGDPQWVRPAGKTGDDEWVDPRR